MKADIDDLELELWLRRRDRGEIKWTTKDGTEIPIKDMTDSHLENTINMIVRNEDAKEYYFAGLSGLADKDWVF